MNYRSCAVGRGELLHVCCTLTSTQSVSVKTLLMWEDKVRTYWIGYVRLGWIMNFASSSTWFVFCSSFSFWKYHRNMRPLTLLSAQLNHSTMSQCGCFQGLTAFHNFTDREGMLLGEQGVVACRCLGHTSNNWLQTREGHITGNKLCRKWIDPELMQEPFHRC